MKTLTMLAIALSLTACSCSKRTEQVQPRPKEIEIQGRKAFIRWPEVSRPGAMRWVWFAPTIPSAGLPSSTQHDWYFQQMSKAGIAVVGIDVGESYGSPAGRALFTEFYQALQGLGLESQGCMLVQSRGGLHGYAWILDNPGKIKCVAGIYPLLTLQDYAGIPAFAPAWGVSEQWMHDNLPSINPLDRAGELNLNILHIHGDADQTTHYSYDMDFVARVNAGSGSATLVNVPGQAHEMYTEEFFKSQQIVDFLTANLF